MSTFVTPPSSPRTSEEKRTPPSSPETPTTAKTRQLITWLMQVNYHAHIASAESLEILAALSGTFPASEINSPELTAVIVAIQAFSHSKIYDPMLSNKASLALDSLSKRLTSPIQISPSPRSPSDPKSGVARTLFPDEIL